MVRLAGIYNGDGIGEVALAPGIRRNPRIERRAPRLRDDVNGGGRIEACREGQEDIVDVGGTDVIVNDDNKAAMIPEGRPEQRHRRVFGMTAIPLFD